MVPPEIFNTRWTNSQFEPLRQYGNISYGFRGMDRYAVERDSYLWPHPSIDASPAFSAFAAAVVRELEKLRNVMPLTELVQKGGMEEVNVTSGDLSLSLDGTHLTLDRRSGAIALLS